MITYLDVLLPIVSFVVAYLIGSIPISVIIGKIVYKQDIREYGSKNPGGTNATRLWGKKVGFSIILLDILKAALPVWTAILIFRLTNLKDIMVPDSNAWAIWIAALGSVVGHSYSIFLKFKGGKGVATTVGSIGTTNFAEFIIGFITFFITLFTKKMVSLASIMLNVVGTLVSWILYILYMIGYESFVNHCFVFNPSLLSMNVAFPICMTLIAIIVVVRHKENIVKIFNGTENKIKSKKVDN